jgi:hypothetical protein
VSTKNRNPITGDKIITKPKSNAFDDNFDLIFRSSKPDFTPEERATFKWSNEEQLRKKQNADKA